MERTIFEPTHDAFRGMVRSFLERDVVPEYAAWETGARPPQDFWRRAGRAGLLGIGVPAAHGGLAGSDFRHSVVVTEEAQRAGLALGGIRLHTDICMPYFLEYADESQQERWLPRLAAGDAAVALAMSEPGAGSDMKAMSTSAVRDGDHYVVNGAKTFISNGLGADLVIVAVKTDPGAGRHGISLLVVEADSPGFTRGRSLEKIGLKAQDLSELFFSDVVVPVENLLGEEGRGFDYLTSNLAQERLSLAVNAQAAAATVLSDSVVAAAASGSAGQNAKFELAACKAEVEAGQALLDRAIAVHVVGRLDAAEAALVKLYCTELHGRVADRCLQLGGAESFATSSRVGRSWADARVSRIYGGSSEIMKVIVAKSLGL